MYARHRRRSQARADRRNPVSAGGLNMPTNIEHPTLAANPLAGIRRRDVLDSARKLVGEMARNPRVAGRQYLMFMRELGRIATGRSELLPQENDQRFADTAWRESGPYRLLPPAHLAAGTW